MRAPPAAPGGSVLARLRAASERRPTAREVWARQVAADRDPGPRVSLAEFTRGAWAQIESAPLAWNWHLDVMCAHAEAVSRGEIRRLIVNVPPGHMKSIVWSVAWPLWEWTQNPALRWLVLSVNELAAKRDARRSRQILESEWFASRWGHRVRLASDERATDDIGTMQGGKRWLRPMEGTITALRGDRVVVDDPQGVKDTLYSAAYREAIREKVRGEVLSRVNDERRSPIVIVQQRIHPQDVTGDLLALGGWDHLCLPLEHDPDVSRTVPAARATDPRTQRGELLHEERFGPEEVEQSRRVLRAYEAQYNQRSEADSGARIKREWFRRWTRRTLPETWDVLATSWDLTQGKARRDVERGEREGRRSWVVGQLWGAYRSGFYLLAQVRGQWEADDQLRTIESFAAVPAPCGGSRPVAQYPTTHYIEDAALGPTAAGLLRIGGIVPVPTGGKSKEERLDDVIALLATARVFVPDDAEGLEWVPGFLYRVCRFPGSDPDDEVDAKTQALAQLGNDPATEFLASIR